MITDPMDVNATHLVRCTCGRCGGTVADYYEPSPLVILDGVRINGGDCYWLEREGCRCDPRPEPPCWDDPTLQQLVDQARRTGRPMRYRAYH